eukprot:scaffold442_cov268-Pinguiococcus_pyrenoidosus.AAC.28
MATSTWWHRAAAVDTPVGGTGNSKTPPAPGQGRTGGAPRRVAVSDSTAGPCSIVSAAPSSGRLRPEGIEMAMKLRIVPRPARMASSLSKPRDVVIIDEAGPDQEGEEDHAEEEDDTPAKATAELLEVTFASCYAHSLQNLHRKNPNQAHGDPADSNSAEKHAVHVGNELETYRGGANYGGIALAERLAAYWQRDQQGKRAVEHERERRRCKRRSGPPRSVRDVARANEKPVDSALPAHPVQSASKQRVAGSADREENQRRSQQKPVRMEVESVASYTSHDEVRNLKGGCEQNSLADDANDADARLHHGERVEKNPNYGIGTIQALASAEQAYGIQHQEERCEGREQRVAFNHHVGPNVSRRSSTCSGCSGIALELTTELEGRENQHRHAHTETPQGQHPKQRIRLAAESRQRVASETHSADDQNHHKEKPNFAIDAVSLECFLKALWRPATSCDSATEGVIGALLGAAVGAHLRRGRSFFRACPIWWSSDLRRSGIIMIQAIVIIRQHEVEQQTTQQQSNGCRPREKQHRDHQRRQAAQRHLKDRPQRRRRHRLGHGVATAGHEQP